MNKQHTHDRTVRKETTRQQQEKQTRCSICCVAHTGLHERLSPTSLFTCLLIAKKFRSPPTKLSKVQHKLGKATARNDAEPIRAPDFWEVTQSLREPRVSYATLGFRDRGQRPLLGFERSPLRWFRHWIRTLKARPSGKTAPEAKPGRVGEIRSSGWCGSTLGFPPEELLKEAREQSVPAEAAPSMTQPWKNSWRTDGWTDEHWWKTCEIDKRDRLDFGDLQLN